MTPRTVDKLGVDLHVGDFVVQALPDESFDIHRIVRFEEYPGRYLGTVHRDPGHPRRIRRATVDTGHARIAYSVGDSPRWRHTIADGEVFHVLADLRPAAVPPAAPDLDRYAPVPCERLVWPAPIEDPAYPAVVAS